MENNNTPSTPVAPTYKVDTHSYKGWLNSDNFLKRAFAIYGYGFVAGMMIIIPFYIIIIIFVVIVSIATNVR